MSNTTNTTNTTTFMQKVMRVIVIVLTIIMLAVIIAPSEKTYELAGRVTNVNYGVVVVDDTHGNSWAFLSDGFSVGDAVVMTMTDNATAGNPVDDAIIDACII